MSERIEYPNIETPDTCSDYYKDVSTTYLKLKSALDEIHPNINQLTFPPVEPMHDIYIDLLRKFNVCWSEAEGAVAQPTKGIDLLIESKPLSQPQVYRFRFSTLDDLLFGMPDFLREYFSPEKDKVLATMLFSAQDKTESIRTGMIVKNLYNNDYRWSMVGVEEMGKGVDCEGYSLIRSVIDFKHMQRRLFIPTKYGY